MNKFTSGKWEVEMVYGDHPIVTADGRIVADCFNNEANARLIAAAPEMYEMLKGIIQSTGDCPMESAGFFREARELLARIARIDGEEAEE